jgi:hypothetical protein
MPSLNPEIRKSGAARGQMALEFLVMFGFLLILFTAAVFLYFSNVAEGNKVDNRLAALKLCLEVSSAVSSAESMGDGVTYSFTLPPHLNYRDYGVWVKSDDRLVIVDYETDGEREAGASCSLHAYGITNSTGSTFFRLAENSSITKNGGKINVRP